MPRASPDLSLEHGVHHLDTPENSALSIAPRPHPATVEVAKGSGSLCEHSVQSESCLSWIGHEQHPLSGINDCRLFRGHVKRSNDLLAAVRGDGRRGRLR